MNASFSLVLTAGSAEELKAKVLEAAAAYGNNTVAPAKEAPKRGRKPKDESPFEEQAEVAPAPQAAHAIAAAPKASNPFDDEQEAKPAKAATLDDVKAQLQKVADTKGMEKAQEIVGALKVTKVKEIQPAQFGEALALCEKALK